MTAKKLVAVFLTGGLSGIIIIILGNYLKSQVDASMWTYIDFGIVFGLFLSTFGIGLYFKQKFK